EPPPALPDAAAWHSMLMAASICASSTRAAESSHIDDLFSRAFRIATEINSPELEAQIELPRGSCFIDPNKPDLPVGSYQPLLGRASQNKPPYLEAYSLVGLQFMRIDADQYDQAADVGREALAVAERLQADLLIVKTLGNLGLCYQRLGDQDNARTYL